MKENKTTHYDKKKKLEKKKKSTVSVFIIHLIIKMTANWLISGNRGGFHCNKITKRDCFV